MRESALSEQTVELVGHQPATDASGVSGRFTISYLFTFDTGRPTVIGRLREQFEATYGADNVGDRPGVQLRVTNVPDVATVAAELPRMIADAEVTVSGMRSGVN